MKRQGILNKPVSSLIAGMGHTDSMLICDAGLPIAEGPERIDLSLRCGLPSFLEVLNTVLDELYVERAAIARETKEKSPEIYEALAQALDQAELEIISHELLKERSSVAKGIVRTGECSPFANVILYSGVVF